MEPVVTVENDKFLHGHIQETYPACNNYRDLRVYEKKLRRGLIAPPQDVHVCEGTASWLEGCTIPSIPPLVFSVKLEVKPLAW